MPLLRRYKTGNVVATNATAESGTAKSEGNKYTLELTDTTSGFPLQLTEAAIEGLTTK